MGKHNIRADKTNNRLYIELDGFFNDEQATEASQEAMKAISTLQPGFAIINDIRNYKPTTPIGTQKLQETMHYAAKSKVGAVVRIVDQDEYHVGNLQFKRKSQSAGYQALEAPSIEEAERLLNQLDT